MEEARLLFKSAGRHVVPLLGIYRQAKEAPVLSFPVSDTVLSRFLVNRGPLCEHVSQTLASQLACGVKHIHALGVLHRDLKPSHILLRYEDAAPHWRLFLAD